MWVENANLQARLLEKDQHISHLEEQLAWFKRQIFGKRSERVVKDLNQQQLMLEGFENLEAAKEEEKKTVAAHTRRKPNRNGQDKITLPPDLPIQTTILDIPEEQKICQETGKPLVQIGVEVTHNAHQPGSYYPSQICQSRKRRGWDFND